MPKVFVVNGHGAKIPGTVAVRKHARIVTPGPAEASYVLQFTSGRSHLEQVTSHGKLWPLQDTATKQALYWHRYEDTEIGDIAITPVQSGYFNMKIFAGSLFTEDTGWEKLNGQEHRVLDHGAMVVKGPDGLVLLKEEELGQYLQNCLEGIKDPRTPIFFCDTFLGKIKTLSATTLSTIYEGMALFTEYENTPVDIVVATCSPDMPNLAKAQHPLIDSEQAPIAVSDYPFNTIAPRELEKDKEGSNWVDSIEVEDGIYTIRGRNNKNEPRYITIDSEGNARGFNGSEDLGYVGKRMFENRAALFKYFNIDAPSAVTGVNLQQEEVAAAIPLALEPASDLKAEMGDSEEAEVKRAFTENQKTYIQQLITDLEQECEGCWVPFRERKLAKKEALTQLLLDHPTQSALDRVRVAKKDSVVTAGFFSQRTLTALSRLEQELQTEEVSPFLQ